MICVFSGLLPSLFEVAVAIEGGASFRSFSFSSASLDALCFTSAVYSVSAEEADEAGGPEHARWAGRRGVAEAARRAADPACPW